MEVFEDIDDIVEWLEPMSYDAFWKAVAPYHLDLDPKWHLDRMIARGEVQEDLILKVLKCMARLQMAEMLGLKWRTYWPPEFDNWWVKH